jgi:hypothetical protein
MTANVDDEDQQIPFRIQGLAENALRPLPAEPPAPDELARRIELRHQGVFRSVGGKNPASEIDGTHGEAC